MHWSCLPQYSSPPPSCLPMSPPVWNSLASSWPEATHVNSYDCSELDPNCRDKNRIRISPLLWNEWSSDLCTLIWGPMNNMPAMQNNKGAVALRDSISVHKGGKTCSFCRQDSFQVVETLSFSPFSFTEATGVLLADTVEELQPSREIFLIKANKWTADEFSRISPLENQAPTSLLYHLAAPFTQMRE